MRPEDLVEIAMIERLKYRYVRLLDLKEWDEIATLFVEHATVSYSDGKYSYEGRDPIVGFLRHSMASTNMLTSHKVHHPEIDLVDGDRATGIWALDDVVIHLDYKITIRGAAFYHDRYVKVDGTWLIEHTGYERVFEEMQPRADDIELTARRWADP